MKTIPALVIAAVVAVGLLAGVTTYQLASGPADAGSEAVSPAVVTTPTARTDQPRTRVRWAPCEPPAVRHGKACVTEEVRTVVVPAPAPAPAAPAAPVAHQARNDDGERAGHEGDDRGTEHEADDEHEAGDEHADEDEHGNEDEHADEHGDEDEHEHEDDD